MDFDFSSIALYTVLLLHLTIGILFLFNAYKQL